MANGILGSMDKKAMSEFRKDLLQMLRIGKWVDKYYAESQSDLDIYIKKFNSFIESFNKKYKNIKLKLAIKTNEVSLRILLNEKDVKECEEKALINRGLGQGITLHTIGIGEDVNENFMQLMAKTGNGDYIKATEKNKLNLLFGKTTEKGDQQGGYSILIKDRNHYITENLKINAQVYGFNEVIPKPSAQLLAVTDQGDPLIVAWRYGLGRVVAVLTDDGKLYAGELLSKENSKLLLRAFSWAAGDPERKGKTFLTIDDGRVGEKIEVLYKGDPPPEGMASFSKVEENTYRTYLDPKDAGFHTFWQATYAVNNPKEYETVGLNA